MSTSGCAMMRGRPCGGPCGHLPGPRDRREGVRRGGACRALAGTGVLRWEAALGLCQEGLVLMLSLGSVIFLRLTSFVSPGETAVGMQAPRAWSCLQQNTVEFL